MLHQMVGDVISDPDIAPSTPGAPDATASRTTVYTALLALPPNNFFFNINNFLAKQVGINLRK
jgi:hypothetical protein